MLDKDLDNMEDFSLDDLMEKIETPSEASSSVKRKSLGRGIGALLGDSVNSFDDSVVNDQQESNQLVDIDLLSASPFQPRKEFEQEALEALSQSIREKGVLQPLLVRRKGDIYEIIAGERRFRASKLAGLKQVPIIQKDFTDKEVAEVALVENLLRENLSAIEEAQGFKKLIDEFSHTQEVLSKIIGKSRSHVANTLRLLNLPENVQNLIKEDKLSAGHARNLVGLDNAFELAKEIISKDLNVRQVEELVAKRKEPIKEKAQQSKQIDPDIKEIQKELIEKLGLKITILPSSSGGGKVVIKYSDIAELDMILNTLEKK